MATFEVKVVKVEIEPHHNADALELARVGDYLSVVGKGQFKTGDLVAYIPEQGVVPDALLAEMNLTGKLAGKEQNRVKAIKLRGVLSQGLCYPARDGWVEGQDVAEELGVLKYIPPIPAHMAGDVWAAGFDRCMRYDIENVKRYPHVLAEGEDVVFTEKLHGTWCQVAVMPPSLGHPEEGDVVISSKGMADQGLALSLTSEANAKNLYCRVARAHRIAERVRFAFEEFLDADCPVFVLGEVFGAGCQDLGYGANVGHDDTLGFRVFDVYTGIPGHGQYLDDDHLDGMCMEMGLERVPVLYRGPFSKAIMEEHTTGKETVSGKGLHIREGIVMRPVVERRHDELGRVQLKSVSEKYILRKGGTEFN